MNQLSKSAYQQLEAKFHTESAINQASSILHWDAATMMPSGSSAGRGEQLAVLAVLAHETITGTDVSDLLDAAEEDRAGLDNWQDANLNEMRRQWLHATAVAPELVSDMVKASNDCEIQWRQARADNNFKAVQVQLQHVLELTIESGQAKAEAFDKTLYDALLDQYEPGGSVARIEALFNDLQSWLPKLIGDVIEQQSAGAALPSLAGDFSVENQKLLGQLLMKQMGFDFDQGRLDVSAHPFCGGVPDDVRITTRYSEDDFTSALMGVLHETGHAMYEAGLPEGRRFQPVGSSRGMSIHESQSLLVEMQVCRGKDFLSYLAPVAQQAFKSQDENWTGENLSNLYTRVERGFIRVDADEVTYPAHVILRFELEKAMIEGDLQLRDLPTAWNDKMQQLLGVVPPNDTVGCLQDIHWYSGAWGYFPTYTLGAMTAAQLYRAAVCQKGEIPGAIQNGDFKPLMTWLGQNVHSKASSLSSDQILVSATGSSLTTDVFKSHLFDRYLA
jgi:carboxypeptidase Taq